MVKCLQRDIYIQGIHQTLLSKVSYNNSHIFIYTFTQWWWQLPCKVLTSTSGAVWGSVSCPKTLRHADQGNQTSNLLITRHYYPWPTADSDRSEGRTERQTDIGSLIDISLMSHSISLYTDLSSLFGQAQSVPSHLFGQTQFDVQWFFRHQELKGCLCYWDQFCVLWTVLDLPDGETDWTPRETQRHVSNYQYDEKQYSIISWQS